MKRAAFGRTGLDVSVLGFGGSEIGYENASDADVGAAVARRARCGAQRHRHRRVLRGQRGEDRARRAGRRDDFHLFTKCGHASGFDAPDWDPGMLAEAIDRSLRRLRTDRIDLVQLHSCDRATLERGDVVEVLRRAKAAGKTRLIGYSGDNEASAPTRWRRVCSTPSRRASTSPTKRRDPRSRGRSRGGWE